MYANTAENPSTGSPGNTFWALQGYHFDPFWALFRTFSDSFEAPEAI